MKKILKKIFSSRSSISNWILALVVYVSVIMFLTIMEMGQTIEKETYLRICPEPYVCVIPPDHWKAKPPMGLTYYKRMIV